MSANQGGNNDEDPSLVNSSDDENGDEISRDNHGMMLLSNAVSERSEEIMKILGSEQKYVSLMDLVTSFRECEDKIQAFVQLWENIAEAHSAIQYLENSPEFFAAFLSSRQTVAYGYGGSLFLRQYAMTRFASGKPPDDIRRIL